MKRLNTLIAFGLMLALAGSFPCIAPAAEINAADQAKIDARVAEIRGWAAEPLIVAAVIAHNSNLPPEHAAMTQAKWRALTLLDPFVRSFSKNEAAVFLKSRKADWLTEAFISDAKGLKVAFLSKPTNWSHAGMPKHEDPMKGKVWQGPITIDESTGLQQMQVSVPILNDGKPVGALVVGISPTKL